MSISKHPRINGNFPDFSSLTAFIRGKAFFGIREVSYKTTREPGTVRGAGPRKLGRTRGEFNHEASIKLLREDAEALRTLLGSGYMEAEFDITVVYQFKGGPLTEDKLFGCVITEDDTSNSSGTDALEITFPLDVMRILYNGLDPIAA